MPRSRRTLLRLGGTALASLSLAGCLGGDSDATDTPGATPTADATPTESPTATPTDSPTPTESPTPTDTPTETPTGTPPGASTDYQRWLPAPSAFDRDHYRFISASVASILDRSDSLGQGATSFAENEYGVPGIDTYGDVTAFYQVQGVGTVTQTPVDRAAIEQAHRDVDADVEESSYEGYTVFEGQNYVGAVGDEAVVTSGAVSFGDLADQRGAVEAFVDAEAGTGTRYVDANEDADRLFAAIGPSHIFQARTHAADVGLPGAVADAAAYYLGSEESEIRTPVVFEDGGVDEDAVAEWASDASVFRDREPTTVTDDRVVTAKVTIPSSDIDSFTGGLPGGTGGGDTSETPTVAFSFDYEETADGEGVLTITHDGGDYVDVANLYLRGDGFADVDADVDQTGPGQWKGSASGSDGESVVAGDSVDIGVSSDYEISVVWESDDGNASATLMHGEGPDA